MGRVENNTQKTDLVARVGNFYWKGMLLVAMLTDLKERHTEQVKFEMQLYQNCLCCYVLLIHEIYRSFSCIILSESVF